MGQTLNDISLAAETDWTRIPGETIPEAIQASYLTVLLPCSLSIQITYTVIVLVDRMRQKDEATSVGIFVDELQEAGQGMGKL